MRPPIDPTRIEVHRDRAAWLASRGGTRIGASEVASVLGISPFRGAWDLWTERRGILPPPDAARERAMARGRRDELRILQDFAEESGIWTCQPWGVFAMSNPDAQIVVRHPRESWATCTPDGLVEQHQLWGGIEVKVATHRAGWGDMAIIERWDDAAAEVVPPHYAVQCYWSMECTGLPYWILCARLPSYPWPEIRWYTLLRDEETQRLILDYVRAWRERHLIRGEAPPIDHTPACGRWVQRHPEREERQATEEEEALLAARREAQGRVVVAQQQVRRLTHRLSELAQGYGLRSEIGRLFRPKTTEAPVMPAECPHEQPCYECL